MSSENPSRDETPGTITDQIEQANDGADQVVAGPGSNLHHLHPVDGNKLEERPSPAFEGILAAVNRRGEYCDYTSNEAPAPVLADINMHYSYNGAITAEESGVLTRRALKNMMNAVVSPSIPGATDTEAYEEHFFSTEGEDDLEVRKKHILKQLKEAAAVLLEGEPKSRRYTDALEIIERSFMSEEDYRELESSIAVTSEILTYDLDKDSQNTPFVGSLLADLKGYNPDSPELTGGLISLNEFKALMYVYTHIVNVSPQNTIHLGGLKARSQQDADMLRALTPLTDKDIAFVFAAFDDVEAQAVEEEPLQFTGPTPIRRWAKNAALGFATLALVGFGVRQAVNSASVDTGAQAAEAALPLEIPISLNSGNIIDPAKTLDLWSRTAGVEVLDFSDVGEDYLVVISYSGVVYHGMVPKNTSGKAIKLSFKSFEAKAGSAEKSASKPIELPIIATSGFNASQTRGLWERTPGLEVLEFSDNGASYTVKVRFNEKDYYGSIPATTNGSDIRLPAM
jgi:hypothetical protein